VLLFGMELLVGRRVDREATVWEAMFIPDVLRDEVKRQLGATPERLYGRAGPVPTLSPLAGHRAMWAAALILTLIMLAGAVAPGGGAYRVALRVVGLILGALGLLVAAMAAASLLPELRQNEVLLVALPTDLLLLFLHRRALFIYLAARVILALVVAGGLVAGLLVAPIWPVWALATGPMTVALLRARKAQPAEPPVFV
jgi:hypothetical protein